MLWYAYCILYPVYVLDGMLYPVYVLDCMLHPVDHLYTSLQYIAIQSRDCIVEPTMYTGVEYCSDYTHEI